MNQITPKERVRATFRRENSDRVPVYPILGCITAQLKGYSIREFLTDAHKFAESHINAYEILGQDVVTLTCDTLLEAEAIGNTLEFPESNICFTVKRAVEDKAQLASLRIIDPQKDGRMPYYLEVCQRVSQKIKDAPVGGSTRGPWTIAANIRGLEPLIYDCSDDPAFVHQLLEYTTEVCKSFGEAIAHAGVGLSLSEAAASCSVISPRIYREFIKPHHSAVINHFKGKRINMTAHVCGYIDPIMEDLIETGVAGLSIDSRSSLAKLVEISRKRVVILGNIDTAIFEHGTPQEMEQAIKKCLEVTASRSPFMLASGCEVPPTSPWENVVHFLRVGREYAKGSCKH